MKTSEVMRILAAHRGDAVVVCALALQLRFPFDVGSAGFGLMCASPDGPCDDVGGPDVSLPKTNSDAPDFLN
jgi:hypothetical protein